MSHCSPTSTSCSSNSCHCTVEARAARRSGVSEMVGLRQSQREIETGSLSRSQPRQPQGVVRALAQPFSVSSQRAEALPLDPPPPYERVVAVPQSVPAADVITISLGGTTMHFPVGTPADVIVAAINAAKSESAATSVPTALPAPAVTPRSTPSAAATVQAPFPPSNKTTAASKHWLREFLADLITQTQTVPFDALSRNEFTMSLNSAMSANLTELSGQVSATLFDAMRKSDDFKASGYNVSLVSVSDEIVSQIMSTFSDGTPAYTQASRAYLAFYLPHDDEPLIFDMCTNCFLKHNEAILGTWEEIEGIVYQHLLNKDIPSPYPATEQGAMSLCSGALKTGDRVFRSNPNESIRLNAYLATGQGNVKELAEKITKQHYGTPIVLIE